MEKLCFLIGKPQQYKGESMKEEDKTGDYVVYVFDDRGNTILYQDIFDATFNQVDLHAQKLKMFYGFGTTYEITERRM